MASAEWIWAPGDWRNPRPVAFFAARDFEFVASSDPALLAIAADEEFVAYLNGEPVARGQLELDRALHPIDIGPRLRSGPNRLVVEARSSRGAGGLRVVLLQGRRTVLATDASWQIFRSLEPGLLRGWLPLDHGLRAASWGRPPVGRWGRQALATPVAGGEPHEETATVSVARGRSLAPRTPWRRDWPQQAVTPALRGASLVDFGHPVEGYLNLRYVGAGDALLFVGLERPPEPSAVRPDHVVVRVPGATTWMDSRVRRVRYVLSVGDSRLVGAWMDSVDPANAPPQSPQSSPGRGVLGIEPPVLRSPVEDKLRREFEGFTRLAGGEEG